MFMHTWFMLGSQFTVLWHDLNLNNQNYLQRNSTNAFHFQYISFIIFNRISNVDNKVTFKEILSHLAQESRHHTRKCTQHRGQIHNPISGPCGIILLTAKEQFPLKHEWMIQTWKKVILNITLFELNIPFDSFNCSANAFLLSEPAKGSLNQITRLCGLNQDKIFYSTSNLVKLKLKVTYVKQHVTRILHFQYQSLSKKTLPHVALHPKEMPDENINLQVFHFTTHADGLMLFYNTHIMMTFLVTFLSEKESIECDMMIYDGPSSKSPLLKARVHNEGRPEYTSTLFCIAVYFRHIPTAEVPDCMNVSVIRRSAPSSGINITKPETLALKFVRSMTNIFSILLFNVPGLSLNLQLQHFQYTGSTEAGCYLGGIIFVSSETNRSFGPFCGEFGMSLLTQKGLTFGSGTVTMLVYSFAESAGIISVGIRIRSEPCIGIINPCSVDLGKYQKHTVTMSNFNDYVRIPYYRDTVQFNVDNRNTGTCFHIQYFFSALENKGCSYRFNGLSRENVFHATGSMYFNKYQTQSCTNCSGAAWLRIDSLQNNPMGVILVRGEPMDNIITKNVHSMSIRDRTVPFNDSAYQFDFWSSVNDKFAKSVDEAFYIGISVHSDCVVSTLTRTYDHERFSYHKVRSACFLTKFNMIPGHHYMKFTLHPNTQIFFSMFFANPTVCTNHSYTNTVFMISESIHKEDRYSFEWEVDENFVNWTIVIPSENEYKVLVVITQVDSTGSSENVPHCPEMLLGHIYHNTSVTKEKHTHQRVSTSRRYCIHFSCYNIYIKASISWSTAFRTCQENNHKLLTINSDLESKIVSDIIESNQQLMVSPVLFLNLKRNNKVTTVPHDLFLH